MKGRRRSSRERRKRNRYLLSKCLRRWPHHTRLHHNIAPRPATPTRLPGPAPMLKIRPLAPRPHTLRHLTFLLLPFNIHPHTPRQERAVRRTLRPGLLVAIYSAEIVPQRTLLKLEIILGLQDARRRDHIAREVPELNGDPAGGVHGVGDNATVRGNFCVCGISFVGTGQDGPEVERVGTTVEEFQRVGGGGVVGVEEEGEKDRKDHADGGGGAHGDDETCGAQGPFLVEGWEN